MRNFFGNYKALSRRELDSPVRKVNRESSLQHVKEFVVIIVLVPVILSLHDAETNDRVVHLAQLSAVPLANVGQRLSEELGDLCVRRGIPNRQHQNGVFVRRTAEYLAEEFHRSGRVRERAQTHVVHRGNEHPGCYADALVDVVVLVFRAVRP